jgi:hypothetical protein
MWQNQQQLTKRSQADGARKGQTHPNAAIVSIAEGGTLSSHTAIRDDPPYILTPRGDSPGYIRHEQLKIAFGAGNGHLGASHPSPRLSLSLGTARGEEVGRLGSRGQAR